MPEAGEMDHALDMPLASRDREGSLVRRKQTNGTMDIQDEERRLSRHLMGDKKRTTQKELFGNLYPSLYR